MRTIARFDLAAAREAVNCGDAVQKSIALKNACDHIEELRRQYDESLDLLADLAKHISISRKLLNDCGVI